MAVGTSISPMTASTAIAHPFPGVEVRGEGHYAILPACPATEIEHGGILNVKDPQARARVSARERKDEHR